MYCNEEIETMGRRDIVELQTERLKKTIKWAYEKSPFYQQKMNKMGLTDKSVNSLDDLCKLPLTTKNDLLAQSPYGFLTGPLSATIRLRMIDFECGSIARSYTNGDIARNIEMTARALVAGGVNMTSILQILADHASESALGIQYAGEVLGATVVPESIDDFVRVLQKIDCLGITALAGNSQQLLKLLATTNAFTDNVDLLSSHVGTIFLLNDSLKNNIDKHLIRRFGSQLFNIYAPAELGLTAVAFECNAHNHLHLQEDNFYVEIINLQNQQPVASGSVGELVLTSLTLESMPVIRYRTGQIVRLITEKCNCGRTLVRLQAI